jgi:hypothetical protein
MLQRTPGRGGFAPFAHLPGTANGEMPKKPGPEARQPGSAPSAEVKRQLAAALLKKRHAAGAE